MSPFAKWWLLLQISKKKKEQIKIFGGLNQIFLGKGSQKYQRNLGILQVDQEKIIRFKAKMQKW